METAQGDEAPFMHTREQQLEEALLQKELLTSIFDTVPCGILRLKRTGDQYELVAMNPAAIRLLGYQDTEVSQLDWSSGIADTVIEEDHQMLARSYHTMQKQGDLDNVQYRVRWHDGTIHWLRGNHAIISDCDGVQIIQRMFVDVTESMELQEQLWREQEMYRLAMESSSDMMYEYLIDSDTLVVYGPKVDADGSSRVEKSEYRHSTQLLQQNQVAHPDDLPLITEKLCRGEANAVEVRFRFSKNKQQDYQWYRITARTICYEGRKYRVVGTIRNIHRAKQEMDAKREELRMSRAILRAMNGSYLSIYYVDFQQDCFYGIWLPGMDFNVRYVRREGLYNQLRSYIEREVAVEDRKRLYQFLDGRNLAAQLQQPNDCVSTEFPVTRGEEKRWLRMDIYMLSKEDGMVCNGVLTVRNVTEERKKELEAQQAERRAKEALAEAYEAARQGNLAKTDFLSKMSHDIRTPMNAIIGMTTLAERNLEQPERLQDCLAKIRLSSEHLLHLINEVLDMSKIESGNLELQEAPFHLPTLLSQTVDIVQQESQNRGQQFTLQIGALEHADVLGDQGRVQRILLNLISNAIKYTPEGGHIGVSLRELLNSANKTGCYELVVEDDGIGMTEEFAQRLFQPFERAEDSRVSKIQGTGLGMPIALNLVRMMNGNIEVETALNKGTKITVTIYLKIPDHEDGPEETAEGSQKDGAPAHAWRILLVEDHDLNREIAQELLEMESFVVETAVDGQDAVDTFRSKPEHYYDAILMDIQMPVMNGYEATRAIRQLNRKDAARIPIIALTANAFADDIYAAKQAGMNTHLAKPMDLAQLRKTLEQWLPYEVEA